MPFVTVSRSVAVHHPTNDQYTLVNHHHHYDDTISDEDRAVVMVLLDRHDDIGSNDRNGCGGRRHRLRCGSVTSNVSSSSSSSPSVSGRCIAIVDPMLLQFRQ